MNMKIPARIQVQELVSSRYEGLSFGDPDSPDDGLPRPLSWDARIEGVDVVRTSDGATLKLQSSAMQTPPQPGWVLVLTDGSVADGFAWTLYGMPRNH